MATTYTQDNTYLTVTTPLGADVLMLTSMHGEEGMSSLFYFDLEMVSTDAGLDFSQIVGKSVTVSLSLDDSTARCINGDKDLGAIAHKIHRSGGQTAILQGCNQAAPGQIEKAALILGDAVRLFWQKIKTQL